MLNKRGFTVVELIMSFAFVGILSAGLFAIIINYREKELETSTITELLDFKSFLTIDIQKDIELKLLDTIDYCRDASGNIQSKCINLYFKNGETKEFSIKSDIKTDTIGEETFTYRVPYISYGGIKYVPPDASNITINSDYLLEYTTLDDDLENNMALYKIRVSFEHNDYDGDIGISIVALGTKNLKTGVATKYEKFNVGDKVKIQLNGTLQLYFNVIKESSEYNDTLILLLDHNLADSSFNTSTDDGNKYAGSIIESKLKNLTSTWNNADSIRLITAEEIGYLVYACPKYREEDAGNLNISSAKAFVYSTNYWTSSEKLYSNSENGKRAWYVNKNSKILTDATVNSSYGIRPVIEVNKAFVLEHTS